MNRVLLVPLLACVFADQVNRKVKKLRRRIANDHTHKYVVNLPVYGILNFIP